MSQSGFQEILVLKHALWKMFCGQVSLGNSNLALEYRMRANANRVLPRECTGHSKHPLPTTQEKTLHIRVYTSDVSGHHQIVHTEVRLIIFFAAKDGEALYRQQKQD